MNAKFILLLMLLTTTAFAEPQIQVTAELTGAAAMDAKKLAETTGERNPFPFKIVTTAGTGCAGELGKPHRYPTTAKGDKFESRHVGMIVCVTPKLQGERITFEGEFYNGRLGASTRPTESMAAVGTVFRSLECPFSGTAELGKQITIDLADEGGLPSTLKLIFTRVEARK